MSSVLSEKPEKQPFRKLKHTDSIRINLKFTIHPKGQRENYVAILNKMITRVQKIINSHRTKTVHRLRAMNVLSELIRTSYSMVVDVEIEQLEREIKALEKEESEAPETEGSS